MNSLQKLITAFYAKDYSKLTIQEVDELIALKFLRTETVSRIMGVFL